MNILYKIFDGETNSNGDKRVSRAAVIGLLVPSVILMAVLLVIVAAAVACISPLLLIRNFKSKRNLTRYQH